jgi:phosphoribosyl 1,2-cyclic phosphodiesterase
MTINFCSLSSGSSGNSIYISTEKVSLLVDSGLSGVRVEQLLRAIGVSPWSIDGLLVTHDHDDHIRGVGVLCRRYNIPVYANALTWNAMNGRIGDIPSQSIREFVSGQGFYIGDLYIKPYSVSHDAQDPVGFTFYDGRAKVSIANDLGCITRDVLEEIADSDFLMLEANHDVEMLKAGPYPWHLKRRILSDKGHLSNEDAGFAVLSMARNRLKAVLLGHLSRENNYPPLAMQTVKGILAGQGIEVGRDMNIDLSFRDRISRVYSITDREVYECR